MHVKLEKLKWRGNIGYLGLNLILCNNINIYTIETDFEELSASIRLRIG